MDFKNEAGEGNCIENNIDFQIEGYIKDFTQLTNINRNMTSDDDDTFIKDISDEQTELNDNENTNVPQPIKTYELKHNIIEGKTYFITINYVKNDIIYVSNTLQITAVSPVPHFKSSGSNIQQQTLMNL